MLTGCMLSTFTRVDLNDETIRDAICLKYCFLRVRL